MHQINNLFFKITKQTKSQQKYKKLSFLDFSKYFLKENNFKKFEPEMRKILYNVSESI
jgi:hypothetical protein